MVSSGCLAFRAVLALGCAVWALAERATAPFDDGVSMMQVSRWFSIECVNTNGEARDAQDGDCGMCYGAYRTMMPDCCGTVYVDDDDFTHSLMCCDCWGGVNGSGESPAPTPTTTTPQALECVNTNGEARDARDDGCGMCYEPYRTKISDCCGTSYVDDDDFTHSLMCCDCWGGVNGSGQSSTPTPTTAAPQEASATGDPHVTNVDGVRFNIVRAGVHEFLRLPRRANQSLGAAEPESLLSVLAKVERADEGGCSESYVKQVALRGGWLNLSGPLRFRAVGSKVDDAGAISMWVNGSQVDAAALGRDNRVQPFLEVTEPRNLHVNHASSAMQKVPMFTVKLSFASATLKIDWMHRSVPGGLSLNHLNFQAFGLRKFLDGSGMDIGGILGRDDHSDAASLPEDCKAAGAELRVSHRVFGEEGGLQIISAAL